MGGNWFAQAEEEVKEELVNRHSLPSSFTLHLGKQIRGLWVQNFVEATSARE
jgi:hypothetical protein